MSSPTHINTDSPIPVRAYIYMVMTVISASSAPVTIRMAQNAGVPSPLIIAIRLTVTALVLAPFILHRNMLHIRRLNRSDWGWLLAAGTMHAAGLLALFFSLEYTSILINGSLRQTVPIWVIGMEVVYLHAVFARRVWVGVFMAVAGSILVAFAVAGDVSDVGTRPLLGGGLAFINALINALYLLIGRKVRNRLPSMAYSLVVFSVASGIVWIVVFTMRTPILGYGWTAYGLVLLVTFVAQFLGHLPINAALQYFPATFVSVGLQLSTALAAVLAFLILSEVPTAIQILGSATIIVGVLLVSTGRSNS